MEYWVTVIVLLALISAPAIFLIWKRNDRELLGRLRQTENRALDRFLWFH